MKKLKIRKGEVINIGKFILTGWREPLDFYAWICSECGELVINHTSTHYHTLNCPLCLYNKFRDMNRYNSQSIGEINNDPL